MTRQKKPHRTSKTRKAKKLRDLRRAALLIIFLLSGSTVLSQEPVGRAEYRVVYHSITMEEANRISALLAETLDADEIDVDYKPEAPEFKINNTGRIGL